MEIKKNDDLTVDVVRFAAFLTAYKVKKDDEAFSKKNLSKFDATTLPYASHRVCEFSYAKLADG